MIEGHRDLISPVFRPGGVGHERQPGSQRIGSHWPEVGADGRAMGLGLGRLLEATGHSAGETVSACKHCVAV